jgi:hypothetical protein
LDAGSLQALLDRINTQLAADGNGPFEWKTIPQGAATSVWAGVVATADEIYTRKRFLSDPATEPITSSRPRKRESHSLFLS